MNRPDELDLSTCEMHPLSLTVVVLVVPRNALDLASRDKVYLSDGERFVEYDTFDDALATRFTRRRLEFGEEL